MTQASHNLQTVTEADSVISASNETVTKLSRLRKSGVVVSPYHYCILCLCIGGIALGFNLYRLGTPSMWFDEVLSVDRARQSLPVLMQIIFATQPNMALYYIFLHFWLSLTSLLGLNPTEIVVRFPSAVFAALSSIAIFLLGKRFLGFMAGLVAAGLYLLNDLQLVYAQQTRSYALQLLLICIAWYALLAALTVKTHQKRWWLCYGIVTVLAIYTHLFSLLILAAQVAAFAGLLLLPGEWRMKVRQQLRMFIASLVGIFVLIAPLLYASRHGGKTGWLPIPHPMDIYLLFLNISANSKIYLYLLLAFCILGLFVAIISYWLWGKQLLAQAALIDHLEDNHLACFQKLLPVGFALLCWLVIPVILSYSISQGSTRLFSTRYLVTVVPPFMLMVGLGLTTIRWRPVQAVLALGLLLLSLHYVPLHYQAPQVEDWNTTSAWLEQQYQANDGLVCYDNAQGCQVCIEYYLTTYPGAAHFTADSPGSFPWVNYDLTNTLGKSEEAVNPQALATFGTNHPRIFFIVGRISNSTASVQAHSAQQWLDTHYHFIDQNVTPSVTIRLYMTS